MDGLALFCNLCADGPVTLRRLRAAGVRELSDLERFEPATLALWLHVSQPQARAFAAEARKLAQRLSAPPRATTALPARTAESAPGVPLRGGSAARESRLVPGLFAGLDERLCVRLAEHGVRSARVLAESAGLDLARRSGVPYSTLLTLARAARRFVAGTTPSEPGEGRSAAEPVKELVPFRAAPRAAPFEPEPPEAPLADAFTLPLAEPESAGPFG